MPRCETKTSMCFYSYCSLGCMLILYDNIVHANGETRVGDLGVGAVCG